jgi:hypothetical protein
MRGSVIGWFFCTDGNVLAWRGFCINPSQERSRMSTTVEALNELCGRLADDRNALLEQLAALPESPFDEVRLSEIALLHNVWLAAEALRETHLPKVGSGSEV